MIIPFCDSWIKQTANAMEYIDPNEGREISAHYGATHAAASFIIWGKQTENIALYNKGINLLKGILDKWDYTIKSSGFHFDFNNFALCLLEEYVNENDKSAIRQKILDTPDSDHNTINWLPMRWAVNRKRIEWGGDSKHEITINQCKRFIEEATNADGGIEDRVPRGMSFNLQYDVATVAVLQYLRIQGENIDLSKELGFLINSVSPDGDINYQGRGTNQVFAWGLWIYLLSTSGQRNDLQSALAYLGNRLPVMLKCNNLMLNNWNGKARYLWWDYHYASVYIAHCLMWLILSYVDFDKKPINPSAVSTAETGLHIYRSDNFFISWFEGRSEYLSEKGPAVDAIWSRKQGIMNKGIFGPWQGPFGNKYIYEDAILKNYCGLIEVKRNRDFSKNRIIKKMCPNLESDVSFLIKPAFYPISICEKDDILDIKWTCNGKLEMIFNLPAFSENCGVMLFVDGKETDLFCTGAIKNQYDWVYLHQSKIIKGKKIKLRILK